MPDGRPGLLRPRAPAFHPSVFLYPPPDVPAPRVNDAPPRKDASSRTNLQQSLSQEVKAACFCRASSGEIGRNMLDSKWSVRLSYQDHNYRFGQKLKRNLRRLGRASAQARGRAASARNREANLADELVIDEGLADHLPFGDADECGAIGKAGDE